MELEYLFTNIRDLFERTKKIEIILEKQMKMLEKVNEATWKMRVDELGELYLTQEETLKFLGISERTLREQRRAGNISWFEVSPRVFKYDRKEIEDFLQRKKVNKLK